MVKGDGSGWVWWVGGEGNGWGNWGQSQPTRRRGPNKPVCDAYTGGVPPCPERGNVCEWRQLIMSCLRGGEHNVLRRIHPSLPPYAARNHASGAHRERARISQDRSIQGAEVTPQVPKFLDRVPISSTTSLARDRSQRETPTLP